MHYIYTPNFDLLRRFLSEFGPFNAIMLSKMLSKTIIHLKERYKVQPVMLCMISFNANIFPFYIIYDRIGNGNREML
jgi:type IV secretory pathway VirJ component